VWEVVLNEVNRRWSQPVDEPGFAGGVEPLGADGVDLAGTIRAILSGFWRQRYIVGTVLALFMVGGLIYALSVPPRFTAHASILIDPRLPSNPTDGTVAQPVLLLSDHLIVDSEIYVLKSRNLIAAVIEKLEADGVTPPAPRPGPIAAMLAPLRETHLPPPGGENADNEIDTLKLIRRNLTVERAGDTYIISLSFEAFTPEFAARVVNEVVEQYFLIQANDALANTQRVSRWLSDRVAELGEEVRKADEIVEAYRRSNDLYAVGTDAQTLPVRVELRSANEELIATRNKIGNLTAQIAALRGALAADDLNVSVPFESGESTTLNQLRADYVRNIERERELTEQLGNDHALTRTARNAALRTRSLIADELANVVDRLVAQRTTLQSQVDALLTRIDALEETVSRNERRSITLRHLERDADAKRQLYESLLGKLNASAQRESFTPSPGRIVSSAVPPDDKSSPNRKLILALSIFGGLVLGSGLAFLREELNDTYLRDIDVLDGLRLPLIGLVPLLSDDLRQMRKAGVKVRMPRKRLFGSTRQRWARFATEYPRSMMAETLRALDAQVASKLVNAPGSVVIGTTSARKGEGKSMLSLNFAAMKASRGYRVALLDLDVRSRGASNALRAIPRSNVLDTLIAAEGSFDELVASEQLFGTYLIGTTGRSSVEMSDPKVRRELGRLVADLRSIFDYIVIDLPPLSGLVDADVAAELTDCMTLAIEWGKTRQDNLDRLLAANARVRKQVVGAIFTKVPLRRYSSYNGSSVHDYYTY